METKLQHTIKTGRGNYSFTRNSEIYKKHLEGWSYAKIGKRFGISKQRAHSIVKKFKQRFKQFKQGGGDVK